MHTRQFFIDGAWVDPVGAATHDVINPATEEKIATISLAAREDVDRAVAAAKRAFPAYAATASRSAPRCCAASSTPTRRDTTT